LGAAATGTRISGEADRASIRPSILTSGYELKPSEIPSSTVYLHKPWGLDDLVIAVAALLQPDNPIHKH
jgi:hypothetical protein